MSSRVIALALVVTAALAMLLAGALAATGVAGAAQKLFVHSTLDGQSVLPERVHWVAKTDVPSAKVRQVDFLIDGKLHWTERKAPFFYGDDGNYLVTTWLKPGLHRFTIRLTEANGSRLSDSVRARTEAPPPLPAGLAGRWRRTTSDGAWTAKIDPTGWRIADPFGGSNYIDVVYPSQGLLQARGGIWTRNPTAAEEANNGAHVKEGNGWCGDTNATDTYHYTATATTLTLTLSGGEHCGSPGQGEAGVWAGTWTRVS